jgi:hypothetical protein
MYDNNMHGERIKMIGEYLVRGDVSMTDSPREKASKQIDRQQTNLSPWNGILVKNLTIARLVRNCRQLVGPDN